jgi:ketosteroid isomerase-like protein
MNVNSPGLVGRDAIRTSFENTLKGLTVRDAVSTSVESQAVGTWAYDRGKFSYTSVSKPGGQTTKVSYVFLQILEKQTDGSWKIKRRMFHSEQPAQ